MPRSVINFEKVDREIETTFYMLDQIKIVRFGFKEDVDEYKKMVGNTVMYDFMNMNTGDIMFSTDAIFQSVESNVYHNQFLLIKITLKHDPTQQ